VLAGFCCFDIQLNSAKLKWAVVVVVVDIAETRKGNVEQRAARNSLCKTNLLLAILF